MTRAKAYQKRYAKARQRRRRTAQERLARDRRQAQQAAEALQQALDDLGLPDDLVSEIEGRLRSQHKLLGKIVGVMCPPLFGCRTNTELCRVRGWDKNLPSRLLGALPKRSWLKRLRRLGLEVLDPLWRSPPARVRPRAAAGNGPGWAMTRCSKSMAISWAWWAPGGVGRNTGCSRALMGSSWSWSSARASWSSPSTLPSVVPTLQALGRRAGTNCTGSRACWMGAWQRSASAAWLCLLRWSWPIVGSAIRSSCAMSPRRTRGLPRGREKYLCLRAARRASGQGA